MGGQDHRVTLPQNPQAASRARRLVQHVGQGWPLDLLEDTVLVTSELVSNAVRYGGGQIVLVVRVVTGTVRVEVHDEGDPFPSADPQGDAAGPSTRGGEHGRGLFIVDAIADRWGIEDHEPSPGKSVWCELSAMTATPAA